MIASRRVPNLLHCNRSAARQNFPTNCQPNDISNYRIPLWRATSACAAYGALAGCDATTRGEGTYRTFQNLALFHHMSVLDNIMVGRHHLLKNNFITGSLYWLTGARREELEHRRKVEEIIDFLDLQTVRKATAGTLPYGLRKRVELARAMALEPRLILLDEPMAGMNFEEKEDMPRYIVDLNEEFGMTVMMIEHDMGVVMDISHRVMVLDFGRKIAEGDPAAVLADPHVKRAYLGEEDEVLVDPDETPASAETAA